MGALCCTHNRTTVKSTDDEQAALTANDEDDKVNIEDIELEDTPELEYPEKPQIIDESPSEIHNDINNNPNHIHQYVCDGLNNCPSALNIAQIIKYYISWISQCNKNSKHNDKHKSIHYYIHKTFPSTYHQYNYSNISLINDFNHILLKHNHEIEAMIRNTFNINSFDYKTHHFILNRNHRDRSQFKSCIKMYFEYKECDDIYTQQLCDKIYSFLFNDITFDNDKEDKEEENEEMNEDDDDDEYIYINKAFLEIQNKNKKRKIEYEKMRGFDRIKNKNKFFTSLNTNGFRYYYWSYYCNKTEDDIYNIGYCVGDWLITQKYCGLKEEILSHSLHLMEWNLLVKSATYCISSTYCKENMICNTDDWSTQYGISCGTTLSIEYIICVLLLCNNDSFRSALFETYYRISEEEDDDALKLRHSNYYQIAKCLREIVECFGDERKDEYWYHSIHKESLMFGEKKKRIKWPFSVTNKYDIIYINTNNEDGLILQLMDDNKSIKYFDCKWWSDFVSENEKLMIGGRHPLSLDSIICIKNGLCDDYNVYLKVFYLIKEVMNGAKYNDEYCDETLRRVAQKLINNVIYSAYTDCGSLPTYIYRITKDYFCRTDRVHINCKSMILIQSNDDNSVSFVNIDILNSLFPNLKQIVIDLSDCNKEEYCMNSEVFEYILLHLKSLNKWNEIKIYLSSNYSEQSLSDTLDLYRDKFDSLKWSLMFEPHSNTMTISNNKPSKTFTSQ